MRSARSKIRRLPVALTLAAALAALATGCTTSPRDHASANRVTDTTLTATGNGALRHPPSQPRGADRTPRPAPRTSRDPAADGSTTTTRARLPKVPATGAILHHPSKSDPAFGAVDGRPSVTCGQLAGSASAARLHARRCGKTTIAPTGQPLIWILGRTDTNRLELQVWVHYQGGWADELVARDPDGSWDRIEVRTPRLAAGGATLVAEFFTGTGVDGPDMLSYDLVHALGGSQRGSLLGVVAHRDLDRGRLVIIDAILDDYSADFSDGAPLCCPRRYHHARIAFLAGAFRYLQGAPVTLPKPLRSIVHGGRYWGVYWTGTQRELRQVEDQLAKLGIRAGNREVGCDRGASEQLAIDPQTIAVSVYFTHERGARSFARAVETYPRPVGFGRVTTYCLD